MEVSEVERDERDEEVGRRENEVGVNQSRCFFPLLGVRRVAGIKS